MYSGGATAGAAAAAAAAASAIKASGAIVQVKPDEFGKILSRIEKALVIISYGGWPSKSYKYLTAYRGFVFYTKSKDSLLLPNNIEKITAGKVWLPG
ncbi:MAG: hypothetical protein JSU69_10710 [Candidatus Zixiibacteriota bacterium]|nr:MAG: hypothetical protein JSU69_10710 [candidate division Zixibacteria bacterium]